MALLQAERCESVEQGRPRMRQHPMRAAKRDASCSGYHKVDSWGRVFTRKPGPPRISMEECLSRNTIPVPESGCLLWIGAMVGQGYGHAAFGGKRGRAHRLVYAEHHGPIPPGLVVRHKCDVPCCVNINHLLLGTHKQNADDRTNRGKSYRGEEQTLAKLTSAQVLEIRSAPRRRDGAALARKYGVSRRLIFNIRTGKAWKHL